METLGNSSQTAVNVHTEMQENKINGRTYLNPLALDN